MFLLLNIYLSYEFYKIYRSSQFDILSEATIENKLKTEEITYVELPKNIKKDKYISATSKRFTKEELEEITDSILKGQSITIIGETTIESTLNEPIPIPPDVKEEDLSILVKNHIYQGDQYRFWSIEESNRTITYYQQIQDKMLYKNISGELTLFLNEEHELMGYRQTLLDNFEDISEEENILQPIKAIEILYESGELSFGSEITKVEPGYYTLVHLTSSQVLTPVWRFVVNGEENLFVNAIDGQIIELGNEEKKIVE